MRFLLPLLLLGALLAAYFLLSEPAETTDEGAKTAAEVEETLEAAPSLADSGETGTSTDSDIVLERSSEEDAEVIVKVLTADGEPADSFTLLVTHRDRHLSLSS